MLPRKRVDEFYDHGEFHKCVCLAFDKGDHLPRTSKEFLSLRFFAELCFFLLSISLLVGFWFFCLCDFLVDFFFTSDPSMHPLRTEMLIWSSRPFAPEMATCIGSTSWMQRSPISEGQTISVIRSGIPASLWLPESNFPAQGAESFSFFRSFERSILLHWWCLQFCINKFLSC